MKIPKAPTVPTSFDAAVNLGVRKLQRRISSPGGAGRKGTSRKGSSGGSSDFEIVIFTDSPHAVFVEYGTVFQPARPFLRPAVRRAKRNFNRDLRARLAKWN